MEANSNGEYSISLKEESTEMFFTNAGDTISVESSEHNSSTTIQKENEQTPTATSIASPLSSFLRDGFVDVSAYTTVPQDEAAKFLGMKASTLSKRWKEATIGRKKIVQNK